MQSVYNDQTRAALKAALVRLGIDATQDAQKLLLEHLRLLKEKNRELNLTRITSTKEAVLLHIEDSLSAFPEFMGRSGRFCDIGTGGGFPGLPLGILSQRPGILLDSVKKKAAAVQSFIDRMELGNLQAKGMRSEELALKEGASFETVVARAVSSLSVVEELATPLLSMGGQLIAMRGTESQEQIDAGMRAAEKLGLSLVSTREFSIGDEKSRYKRSIFVFEKTRESRVKVPRRPGMAVKHPLA